ncbi:MAG: phospholipid/cholesterol/gamma-HCH transport system substrate-binding protein [Thermoanaerobaculia bacterium]|jgi:phospholipid/cholesterol/gamma-HCH transport system substrate-binding protein|nr:phospholipid/cholesterol/gamma-HCH transport system substrate-binding protein [Thermoanaerobaculia bacterium]
MSSAAKVGVFMLIVLAILGYFVLKIEDVQIGHGTGARKVTALFDSVAGLDNKSAVRVAGVRVGKVANIKLRPDGKAEVTLDVDPDVILHPGAVAHVANLGLLGEKYVELDPGPANAPVIPQDQAVVLHGTQPPSMDDITSQVSAIATDVKAITESLRGVMAGPAGQQRLVDIVENVRTITEQVRDLVAANRSNVDATVANARAITESLRVEIPRLASSIDRMATQMNGTVGENREDVRHIVENLRTLSADLKTTSDNLNNVTTQIRSGEGTVGKLLYSNEAHDRLTAALGSVESGVNELRNTLGRASKMQLDLGLNGDYYANLPEQQAGATKIGGNARTAVWLRLNPNPDRNRFYNVELADTPFGKRREKTIEETVTNPITGVSQTTITQQTRFDRAFLASAQVGWTLAPFAVRLGVIDSSGGAGIDYNYNKRIRVTGEVFDFSHRAGETNPHLRLYGEYIFRQEKPTTPTLFLRSGVDNVLNHTAFTFGGGIRWRDDDLKYLLGSIPIK